MRAISMDTALECFRLTREEISRLSPDAAPTAFGILDAAAAEELSEWAYLWDATEPIVRRLRRHLGHLDGDRVYAYRSGQETHERRIRAHLEHLAEYGVRDTLYPENPALGGYGFVLDEFGLHNGGSDEISEALLALHLEGLLAHLRGCRPGALIWHPYPRWGGLAAALARAVPRATIVISDYPLRLLGALTWLRTTCPGVPVELVSEESCDDLCRPTGETRIVALPCSILADWRGARLDALIDLHGFSRVSAELANAHVDHATRLGADAIHGALDPEREREVVSGHTLESEPGAGPRSLEDGLTTTRAGLRGRFGGDAREFVFPPAGPPPSALERSPRVHRRLASNRLRHYTTWAPATPVPRTRPRIGLGMTVHNGMPDLENALRSILNQSHRDFVLVIVDDASTDGSPEILRAVAASDARVELRRNESRAGMVRAWQQAFEGVEEVMPDVELFAWVSDHDDWEPTWLAHLVMALEEHPDAVLAYPITRRITLHGELETPKTVHFDTRDLSPPAVRAHAVLRRLAGAGNMVYGLVRCDALRAAGVFRPVIFPDRLLMHELALAGTFVQVQRVLWSRRATGTTSIGRQRRALFTDASRPASAYLPWWLVHACTFLTRARRSRGMSRATKIELALHLACTQGFRQLDKRFRIQERRGKARRALLVASAPARKFARRWFKRGRRAAQIARDFFLRREVDWSRRATTK